MRWISAAVLLGTLFSALPAEAQWCSTSKSGCDWWHRYWASWNENNKWPQQWVGYDRQAVCVPLSLQAEKGWHRMNLLGAAHFDPATNHLNQAGERKVRYILTQQLPERRTIFVERGMTPEFTAERVDAVQQAALAMMPTGDLPVVADSDMILEGWPADDVDAVLKGFDRTRPDPRLPASSTEASNVGEVN
jgi:hypothetical protein